MEINILLFDVSFFFHSSLLSTRKKMERSDAPVCVCVRRVDPLFSIYKSQSIINFTDIKYVRAACGSSLSLEILAGYQKYRGIFAKKTMIYMKNAVSINDEYCCWRLINKFFIIYIFSFANMCQMLRLIRI